MTKAEAAKFANRLVAGYIENLFHANGADPLVYDERFVSEAEGRRLSSADYDRVCDAMVALQAKLIDRDAGKARLAQVDGTPGSRWRGYDAWIRKQERA